MGIGQRWGRWLVSLGLAAGVLGGPAARPAAATAPAGGPAGGNFVVNTASDVYETDTFLSLREALAVANGSSVGSFSAEEALLLGGCTIEIGVITGGCGSGITDTISFASGVSLLLVLDPTNGPLPAVDDSAPTIIDAVTNGPFTLNAANAGAGQAGLTIASDNNIVSGLIIVGSQGSGYSISGSYNTLTAGVGARNNSFDGLSITGSHNLIEDAVVGVFILDDILYCSGNGRQGISLSDTADLNTIRDSLIGCNDQAGVKLEDGNENVIGPGNRIGSDLGATQNLGNSTGVLLEGTGQENQIITNTIAYNAGHGVRLRGPGGTNYVSANLIAHQSGDGVRLSLGTQENRLSENTITNNGGYGVVFEGEDTSRNELSGGAITDNGQDGLAEREGAVYNTWSSFTATGNGGLGLDRAADGDTDTITGPLPVITSTALVSQLLTVRGTVSATLDSGNNFVELYWVSDDASDFSDPSGHGEGVYLAYGIIADDGTWTVTFAGITAEVVCVTALAITGVYGSTLQSSEFAANTCTRYDLYLPFAFRP